jgi:energy-coupling factor transport system ATP-binding protein
VVELGRLAGWDPLPLSVRDARRAAGPLRARLRALPAPADPGPAAPTAATEDPQVGRVDVRSLTAGYRGVPVLRTMDLAVAPGEVLALMGRNGAGKSTLLATLAGMRAPDAGTVRMGGHDPRTLVGHTLLTTVGLVPQEPADLLYATTVGRECGDADACAHAAVGTAAGILSALAPGIDASRHPRDLSEGQRLALALAVVLAAGPPILLLDEPTRGLDYGAKRRLIDFLHSVRRAGHTVVLATHDVELVAEVATRVAVIADGEIVADGTTGSVVRSSPLFAPQVAKILTPEPWLTVGQVAEALEESS